MSRGVLPYKVQPKSPVRNPYRDFRLRIEFVTEGSGLFYVFFPRIDGFDHGLNPLGMLIGQIICFSNVVSQVKELESLVVDHKLPGVVT